MFRVRVIEAAIEKLSGSRAQKILEREEKYSFKNRFRTIDTKYVRNFEKFLRYAHVKIEYRALCAEFINYRLLFVANYFYTIKIGY